MLILREKVPNVSFFDHFHMDWNECNCTVSDEELLHICERFGVIYDIETWEIFISWNEFYTKCLWFTAKLST